MNENNDNINLLDLPECVLDEVFSYLTYDEIAKKRLVDSIKFRKSTFVINK